MKYRRNPHLFRPMALRLKDKTGNIVDTVRSIEPFTVEMEYNLSAPLTGLRIGIYISTSRGEFVLTSFDTDDQHLFEKHGSRPAGHYVSRCTIPAGFSERWPVSGGCQCQFLSRPALFHG